MKALLNIYDKISEYRIRFPRLIDAKRELSIKYNNKQIPSITREQKHLINLFWKKECRYVGNINYKYLALYNRYNECFDSRYIPDNIYYSKIDTYYNNSIDCMAIDDKNMYDLYFPDVNQPNTIARKIKGNYLDAQYNFISIQDIIANIKERKNIIIKKAISSDGGNGIRFWNLNEGIELLQEYLSASYDYIVQEVIIQHPDISKLHSKSINSIRLLTLNRNNMISVLSGIIRMGVNGSKVDNGHSGGIFCGINDDGSLKDCAYKYMTGKRFEYMHPNGAVFSETTIPNYDKCKELVMSLSPRMSRVSNLTSWDLSVDLEGNPILIEVNLAYGGLFFHQMANGPIFGDMTQEILMEVFNKK